MHFLNGVTGGAAAIRVLLAAVLLTMATGTVQARLYAVDYMDLATVLLYDGELDKAREALAQVDTSGLSFDLSRFQMIEGLIALKADDYELAADRLREAIASTRIKKFEFDRDVDQELVRLRSIQEINLHYAEALYHLDRCEEVIEALDEADQMATTRPQLYALRADCNWRLGFQDIAITDLNNGYLKYPDAITLMKQKFNYYVRAGLYSAAADVATELLEGDDLTADDYLGFVKVFDGSGQTQKALTLAQESSVRFPDNAQFPLFMGHLYLKEDQLFIAALQFELAAQRDQRYASEAAEVYRRVGLYPTALRLNASVVDVERKLVQLVAILVDLEEFERVVALAPDLKRSGLMADDNMRYAIAYAHFRLQEFDRAETYLAAIGDDALFTKATAIRQSIATCQGDPLACE